MDRVFESCQSSDGPPASVDLANRPAHAPPAPEETPTKKVAAASAAGRASSQARLRTRRRDAKRVADDAVLLDQVRRRIALARTRAPGAADVTQAHEAPAFL